MCHWTGELSEEAESPETEDNKSKDVEGELVSMLQVDGIDKKWINERLWKVISVSLHFK